MKKRVKRAGLKSIKTFHFYKRKNKKSKDYELYFSKMFDAVLIDAPCSGIGASRRMPMQKWRANPKLIKKLSGRQLEILETYSKYLKAGGILVYATCSLMPEENEQVIQHLLDNNKNLKIEEINLPLKTRPGITKWKNKTFNHELKKAARIYHHDNDMEGFFVCKMKKFF